MQSAVRRQNRSISLILAGALILGAGAVTGVQSMRHAAGEIPEAGIDNASRGVLDDVPGLGIGDVAVDRDDLIAYWEAWQRAQQVKNCMADAGFEWILDPNYPADSTRFAELMDVSPPVRAMDDPEVLHGEYLDQLSHDDRDGYFRALYGESAEDMDAAEGSGMVPAGRTDFAEGGCKGRAWEEVGTVWEIKDLLADDLRSLRVEATETTEFDATVAAYKECAHDFGVVAESPADLELSGAAPELIIEVAAACDVHWTSAVRDGMAALMPSFRSRNLDVLERHRAKYENAAEQAFADVEFRAYVAGERTDGEK